MFNFARFWYPFIVTFLIVLTDYIFNNFITVLTILIGLVYFLYSILFYQKISFKFYGLWFIKFWALVALLTIVYLSNSCEWLIPAEGFIKQNTDFTISSNLKWTNDFYMMFGFELQSYYYIFTISIISVFANHHALKYMISDQKKEKFLIFLNGFALSMVMLVISKNLFIIFICWELLGITSFFLINHSDTQIDSWKAAWKAVTYNRVSDISLVLSLVIFYSLTNKLNISASVLDTLASNKGTSMAKSHIFLVYLLLFFIFIAASAKSVQIFSYMWLPDSMKAPTPASALIHSATLVAAGFYLILVFKSLYFNYWGLTFMTFIGLVTALIASLCAAYQDDLKRILAFSTVANCGFMLTLVAMYDVRMFLTYFVAHGIFKSVCFMLSGEIIVAQQHNQDVRTYYSLLSSLSVNVVALIPCLITLAGFPVTTVYLIKHFFTIQMLPEYQWYSLDTWFKLYSFFSLMYSISFMVKVFLYKPSTKEFRDIWGDESGQLNFCVTLSYVALALTTSLVLNITLYSCYLAPYKNLTFMYCVSMAALIQLIYLTSIIVSVYFFLTANPFEWDLEPLKRDLLCLTTYFMSFMVIRIIITIIEFIKSFFR